MEILSKAETLEHINSIRKEFINKLAEISEGSNSVEVKLDALLYWKNSYKTKEVLDIIEECLSVKRGTSFITSAITNRNINPLDTDLRVRSFAREEVKRFVLYLYRNKKVLYFSVLLQTLYYISISISKQAKTLTMESKKNQTNST